MEKNSKNCFIQNLPYFFVSSGIAVLAILRAVNVVPKIDIEYIYLLLILSVLAVIPQFSAISFNGIKFEKTGATIQNADVKTLENDEKEEEAELKEDLSKIGGGKEQKIDAKQIKMKILNKFCEDKGISKPTVLQNRQIITKKNPISADNPVFSWYLENFFDQQSLMEAKFTSVNRAYYNKLYVMLSKILGYNSENKNNEKKLNLILLVKEYNEQDKIGVKEDELENLKNTFSPAIGSGLLRIEPIEI